MRTNAFILLCLMGLSGLSAHAQTESRNETNDPKVNIGIKAGFNSTMFFIDHFTLGENELQDIQNNYKIGYFGAFFCRFNLKKHHSYKPNFRITFQKGVFRFRMM